MTASDLKSWRLSLGFTKAAAARALAMTRRNYDNLENGRYKITRQTIRLCAYVTFYGPIDE